MNTKLVKRCELQVFDLDRNPVLWRRSTWTARSLQRPSTATQRPTQRRSARHRPAAPSTVTPARSESERWWWGFGKLFSDTFGNLGHVTGLRKHECLLTAPPPFSHRFSGTFTGPPVFAPLRRIQSNRCVFRASFLNEALPEILCG